MPATVPEQWLLALADPAGPHGPLPDEPMRSGQLDAFRTAADRHGVLPAVVANLRKLLREHRPGRFVADDGSACLEEMLGAARERLVARTGLSLLLRRRLRDIMALLVERGVPAIVLKGPEFCDRLYPDPVLRPFTDIDLLAPPDGVPQVEAALQTLGYRPEPPPTRKHAGGYGERTWRLPGEPTGAVEVHWDLVNSPPLRRRISVGFADLQLEGADGAPRATPASLLAIAAVHGAAGHRFDRLQVLCDVCQAARGAAGEVDEAWLGEFGRRTGSSEVMATALHLAGQALGEARCDGLRGRVFGRMPGAAPRLLLSPGVVLRSRHPLARLRRQLYRELLKRR